MYRTEFPNRICSQKNALYFNTWVNNEICNVHCFYLLMI